MKVIQNLVEEKDWIFQSWNDRYGRGIWTAVTPHVNHSLDLYDMTDESDLVSMAIGDYLEGDGAWLPTALGSNIQSSINLLEEKLMKYQADSTWQEDVYAAFQAILEDGLSKVVEEQPETLHRK